VTAVVFSEMAKDTSCVLKIELKFLRLPVAKFHYFISSVTNP